MWLAVVVVVMSAACGDVEDAGEDSPAGGGRELEVGADTPTTSTTTTPVAPPTTEVVRQPAFERLDVGVAQPVQVWSDCGIQLYVGNERYVPDREILAFPGRDWQRSDFPPDWDVVVYNQAPADGPDWVMLDGLVERRDESTLEVRHAGSGRSIAEFVLDPTPSNEVIVCG